MNAFPVALLPLHTRMVVIGGYRAASEDNDCEGAAELIHILGVKSIPHPKEGTCEDFVVFDPTEQEVCSLRDVSGNYLHTEIVFAPWPMLEDETRLAGHIERAKQAVQDLIDKETSLAPSLKAAQSVHL